MTFRSDHFPKTFSKPGLSADCPRTTFGKSFGCICDRVISSIISPQHNCNLRVIKNISSNTSSNYASLAQVIHVCGHYPRLVNVYLLHYTQHAMLHDFQLTDRAYIFWLHSLSMNPQGIRLGNDLLVFSSCPLSLKEEATPQQAHQNSNEPDDVLQLVSVISKKHRSNPRITPLMDIAGN